MTPRRSRLIRGAALLIVCAAGVWLWTLPSRAQVPDAFQYNIISVLSSTGAAVVGPGEFAVITFSVTNPATGAAYDLKTDPAWTQATTGASRLFL